MEDFVDTSCFLSNPQNRKLGTRQSISNSEVDCSQGEQLQELGETPSVVSAEGEVEEPPICIVDELKLLIQDNEELTIKNRKLERDLRMLKNFVSSYLK